MVHFHRNPLPDKAEACQDTEICDTSRLSFRIWESRLFDVPFDRMGWNFKLNWWHLINFSVDLRSRPLGQAKHWADARLNHRATFVTTDVTSLLLTNVTDEDSGVYRCRVDFRHSPTRHFRYKLNIVRKWLLSDSLEVAHVSHPPTDPHSHLNGCNIQLSARSATCSDTFKWWRTCWKVDPK